MSAISKEQHQRIRDAATELLRLRDAGAAVDPATTEWATSFLGMNPYWPPPRPSPNRDAILKLLGDAPDEGYMAHELLERTEINVGSFYAGLSRMARDGAIAMLLMPGRRSRYFLNEVMLERGRPLVVANEEMRRVVNIPRLPAVPRPPKPPRPAPPPKPVRVPPPPKPPKPAPAPKPIKPPKPPKRVPPAKKNITFVPKVGAPLRPINQSVVIPEHVKVQVCPSSKDTRYTPSPDTEGAGFMSDWRAKRNS